MHPFLASTRARAQLSETFNNEQSGRRTAHNNTHTPYDPTRNDGDDGARSGELAGLGLSIILLTATRTTRRGRPSHPATQPHTGERTRRSMVRQKAVTTAGEGSGVARRKRVTRRNQERGAARGRYANSAWAERNSNDREPGAGAGAGAGDASGSGDARTGGSRRRARAADPIVDTGLNLCECPQLVKTRQNRSQLSYLLTICDVPAFDHNYLLFSHI